MGHAGDQRKATVARNLVEKTAELRSLGKREEFGVLGEGQRGSSERS